MPFVHRSLPVVLLLALLLPGAPLRAQVPDSLLAAPTAAPRVPPLTTIGGAREDRLRLLQILGRAPSDGYLIRSPSTLTPPLDGEPANIRWAIVAPELALVWNSDLPYSLNDGAMWAGRGLTTRLLAGVRAAYGPVELIVAPELIRTQNRGYQTVPSEAPDRSAFVPPWYLDPVSADLPLRFGTEPFTLVSPGQSSLTVYAGPVAAGASTENQWWGPGARSAIVMSNHAAGIPHLFLRTTSPLRLRGGAFEAKWMIGGLTESLFFDALSTNDIRSISALALTFRPATEPDLTIGLARAVYAPVRNGGAVPTRAFDVFTRWDRPLLDGDGDGARDNEMHSEQIFSLFGRWLFPADGLEVYGEWARVALPASLRDALTAPNHTQGYTLGLQWARPLGDSSRIIRLRGELTYLEQSSIFRERPTPGYYTSRFVVQGYTQRGQVVGAAIGPGASSPWVGADFFTRRWNAGVFAGRIRWENDAYYRQATGISFLAHDVSILGGVRGTVVLPWAQLSAELTTAKRYNYLFQNPLTGFGEPGTDIRNTTLDLTVTLPRLGAAGRDGLL